LGGKCEKDEICRLSGSSFTLSILLQDSLLFIFEEEKDRNTIFLIRSGRVFVVFCSHLLGNALWVTVSNCGFELQFS
jgi:hypothetical protein